MQGRSQAKKGRRNINKIYIFLNPVYKSCKANTEASKQWLPP